MESEPFQPTWPTRDEYDLAMLQWKRTLNDSALRAGELSRSMGKPRHYGAALYASVYRIGDWMVRCFRTDVQTGAQPPKDIAERYQQIAAFTQAYLSDVSALLPIAYLENEILVSGKRWPLVKMPCLTNALQLGPYLQIYHTDRARMHALGEAWRTMIREMEQAHFAHGDLDLTNVLIQWPRGRLSLKLIDYDSVYIPALAGAQQTEYGHEAFQHPAFQPPNKRPYNEKMDRFSALVIYLCIRALELQPSLYKELEADESERLLMGSADYEQPELTTSAIQRLQKKCGGQVKPLVDELMACLAEKRMPRALDEIADRTVVPTSQVIADSTSPSPRAPRVFVSHSHQDDAFTQRLVDDLTAAGASVWVDQQGIRHGNFMQEIDRALVSCEWMVLVLTPNAVESVYVNDEVYTALHRVKQGYMRDVIPVLATACLPGAVPPQWDVLHRYDATRDYGTALAGLLRALGLPGARPSDTGY